MSAVFDILRVVHLFTAILMAWPFYALVAVNQRVRLGSPLGDRTDLYMENIIKNRTVPCLIFQFTAGITGIALMLLRGVGLGALVTNPAIALKAAILTFVIGLLSYVHLVLQPKIDVLFAQAGDGPMPPEIAESIGDDLPVLRARHSPVGGSGLGLVPVVAQRRALCCHHRLRVADLQQLHAVRLVVEPTHFSRVTNQPVIKGLLRHRVSLSKIIITTLVNDSRWKNMVKDLKVKLENRPGSLADLGEALGKAGVNIDGMCGPCEGDEVAHVLVDDVKAAKAALKEAGIEVLGKSEVLVLDVQDKPGVLGEVCRRLSDAGVNIDYFYVATGTRIVLGVDDPEKAKAAV
jgi:hypothetical protein